MIAIYIVDKSVSTTSIVAPFYLVYSSAMWRAIPMQRAIPKPSCYQLLVPNTITVFDFASLRVRMYTKPPVFYSILISSAPDPLLPSVTINTFPC